MGIFIPLGGHIDSNLTHIQQDNLSKAFCQLVSTYNILHIYVLKGIVNDSI